MSSTSTAAKKRTRKSPILKLKKRDPDYGEHYYLTLRDEGFGCVVPSDPTGNKLGCDSMLDSRPKEHKTEQRRFKPLKTVNRFRCLHIQWHPAHKNDINWISSDLTSKEKDLALDLARKAWRSSCEKHAPPTSLIDIPRDSDIFEEDFTGKGDISTRSNALAYAAERNRRSLKAAKKGVCGIDWVILVEIGKPVPLPLTVCELDVDGVGYQEQMLKQPIRLVLPTKAELAKYGDSEFVAATLGQSAELVKGGAA